MYKLAIFDLDGTLLDTLDDLVHACNHALGLSGYPHRSRDAYKRFIGNGLHNLILRAVPPDVRSAAAIHRVEAAFHEFYTLHSQDQTRPYDGIIAVLVRLREVGVKIAVLSNKPDAHTLVLAKQYFPDLIDLALGQREGVPIKPDPAAVYEIMAAMECCGEDCIYIGDSGVDMRTGANAGLATVGVTWGFRTKEELVQNDAICIIDKPDELYKIVVDK